ncbi:MAG: fibrillin [Cyanothece sp. SIO1E1]|nr:fibrillin [Cyanothece sp. SIO1E1]
MSSKAKLIQAIAGTNRGIFASATEKQSILDAVAQLENHNPTANPVEATDLLGGTWRLLYTTNAEILGIDRYPLLKLGQVYQHIETKTPRIYNIAEVYGLPYLEGLVSVAAQFQGVSATRVEVNFERLILGIQRLLNYQSAMDLIEQLQTGHKLTALDFNLSHRDRKGWLDTTYLDDNLRIGRGNQGNVFVLAKA